jgi:hypothetical protein
MNKLTIILAALLLVACNPSREVVAIVQGPAGPQGPSGSSCSVSQVEGGALLACADGSLALIPSGSQGLPGTPGETGDTGPTGETGPAGSDTSSVELTDYTGATCTLIDGTTSYVKKSGSNYKLYTGNTCHSSTSFAEVAQGEAYWVSATSVAIHSSSALRVATFGSN